MTTQTERAESTCTCAANARVEMLEARMTRRIDNLYYIISGGLVVTSVVILIARAL